MVVTTGATVFYGAASAGMSNDDSNVHAGPPYVVTGWLSVRALDGVHHVSIGLSGAFVIFASVYLALRKR